MAKKRKKKYKYSHGGPGSHPEESNSSSWLDYLQTGLDVAGLVPFYGEMFDGINAAIYAARGDKLNAALSLGAMVPLAGASATLGKLGAKAVDAVPGLQKSYDKVNDFILKRQQQLRTETGMNNLIEQELTRNPNLTRDQAREIANKQIDKLSDMEVVINPKGKDVYYPADNKLVLKSADDAAVIAHEVKHATDAGLIDKGKGAFDLVKDYAADASIQNRIRSGFTFKDDLTGSAARAFKHFNKSSEATAFLAEFRQHLVNNKFLTFGKDGYFKKVTPEMLKKSFNNLMKNPSIDPFREGTRIFNFIENTPKNLKHLAEEINALPIMVGATAAGAAASQMNFNNEAPKEGFKYGGNMKKINKYAIGGFSYQPDEMSGATVGILGKTAGQLGLKPQSQLKHERKNRLLKILPAAAGLALGGLPGLKVGMGVGSLMGGIQNQDLNAGTALASGMNIFTGAQNISPDSFGAQLLQGIMNPGQANNTLFQPQEQTYMQQIEGEDVGFAMGGRVEAEGGEFYVSDDGIDPVSLGRGNLKEMSDGMFKIGGPSHSSGGVDMGVGEGYIHSKRFLSDPALGKKYKAKNNSEVAENIAKLKNKLEAFGNAKEDVNTKALKMAELDNDLITLEKSGEQYKQMKGIDSAGNKIAKYGMTTKYKNGGDPPVKQPDYLQYKGPNYFMEGSPAYDLETYQKAITRDSTALSDAFFPSFMFDEMKRLQLNRQLRNKMKPYTDREIEDLNLVGKQYTGPMVDFDLFLKQYKAKGVDDRAYGGYGVKPRFNEGGDTLPTDFSKYLPEGGIPKSVQYAKYIPAIANLFAPTPDPIRVDRPVNKMEKMDFNPLLDRYLKSIGDSESNLIREIGQSGVTGGRGLASKIAVGAKSDRQRGKAYENISQLALRDKSMMDRLGFGYDKLDSQLGLQELRLNLAQEQATAAQKAKGLQQFGTNLQTDFWDPIKFSATGTTMFDQMGRQRNPYSYSAMGGPTSYIDSYYTNILNER